MQNMRAERTGGPRKHLNHIRASSNLDSTDTHNHASVFRALSRVFCWCMRSNIGTPFVQQGEHLTLVLFALFALTGLQA